MDINIYLLTYLLTSYLVHQIINKREISRMENDLKLNSSVSTKVLNKKYLSEVNKTHVSYLKYNCICKK